MKTILGQESWTLRSDKVSAHVTRIGGHLGPVTFVLGGKKVQPFHIAPWAVEGPGPNQPPVAHAMRGDFFCLPFGGNDEAWRGEKHPPHGETSNARWKLERREPGRATWSLRTRIRPGLVRKTVELRPGESAVYQRHEIRGMKGPMNPGHHAMLRFPEKEGSGRISAAPFAFGQVYPGSFEDPARGGYSILKPGARFTRLERVARADGGTADLSRYPARSGYEDLAMLVSKTDVPFGWTAVAFPEEGYAWFALKDPRVLRQTVFWMSNGGRHYAPWSGRHRGVLGLEEVTSYFHEGLALSARPNPLNRKGIPTCLKAVPDRPLVVNYIMAVAAIPRRFERVKEIVPQGNGVALVSPAGESVRVKVDLGFLRVGQKEEEDRSTS